MGKTLEKLEKILNENRGPGSFKSKKDPMREKMEQVSSLIQNHGKFLRDHIDGDYKVKVYSVDGKYIPKELVGKKFSTGSSWYKVNPTSIEHAIAVTFS